LFLRRGEWAQSGGNLGFEAYPSFGYVRSA
jgi:hypothetical protein